MQKIRIVGLQSQKGRIIAELHRLGVIDIRKSALSIEDDKPGESLPSVSELVVRYNSAISILSKHMKKGSQAGHHAKEKQSQLEPLMKTASRLQAVNDTIALDERKTALEGDISRLDTETKTITLFLDSGIDFSQLRSETLDFAAFLLSRGTRGKAQKHIAAMRHNCEVIENRVKGGLVVFVAYKKDEVSTIDEFAHLNGVKEIDISSERFDSTPEKVLAELSKTRKEEELELKSAVAKLEEHAAKDYNHIASVLEMLSVEAERASVSISFKRTESTFAAEGWIEKKKLPEVSAQVSRVTGDHFVIEELEDGELAPTLVSRPRFFRPFDNLMEFFSLPRSDELDPTWIFIIAFPIFYGLMVSDVGYGIASFVFAWLIAAKTEPDSLMNSVAKIWQISSVAIIVFGFLSNQYFGFGLNQYLVPGFTGFDWLKNTPIILAATVIFGIAQVVVGLLFGFVNSNSHGHRKLAFARLTSIAAVVTGTVAVGGALFGLFSPAITDVAAGLGILSVVATVALSGIEATEVVSLISHPLSYARIMGFGLASVILALLIDKTFTPSLAAGILPFLLTSVIFILLHFVNMILGIFEGLVQGARLNFVEFFSKFYTGGGVKFKPFFYRRRYTKEV
ncbi:MAG: hypothetical protein KGH57_03595 [Candidatus Micrarchaeota archaeon]|nr:hypothetical protein [Candidatus Micrarchaeota archaeon]